MNHKTKNKHLFDLVVFILFLVALIIAFSMGSCKHIKDKEYLSKTYKISVPKGFTFVDADIVPNDKRSVYLLIKCDKTGEYFYYEYDSHLSPDFRIKD